LYFFVLGISTAIFSLLNLHSSWASYHRMNEPIWLSGWTGCELVSWWEFWAQCIARQVSNLFHAIMPPWTYEHHLYFLRDPIDCNRSQLMKRFGPCQVLDIWHSWLRTSVFGEGRPDC
jgi:hypothetical protein